MNSKRNRILLWTTLITLAVCVILIAVFSGCSHSAGKFKTIFITLVLVLLFHYLIGDSIKFVLCGIGSALWPPERRNNILNDETIHYNRLDYLNLRLEGLRGSLYITANHRNEQLNMRYREVLSGIWLNGNYFILLFCLLLLTRDGNKFYDSKNINQLFSKHNIKYFGFSEINQISDVYKFIDFSLIKTLNSNEHRVCWLYGDQTALLGVVRLRQLRLTEKNYGLTDPPFTDVKYLPKWGLPYQKLLYNIKHWRIFEPWIPTKSTDQNQNRLTSLEHYGYYRNYPEQHGYVALLARSHQNSLTILKYLDDNKWINHNTSALFMDFSLYNMDANNLNVCNLRLEQTPFGSIIVYAEVDSISVNFSNISTSTLIVLFFYTMSSIQLFKTVFLKLWYNPRALRKAWNQLDLAVFLLNMILLVLMINYKLMVSSILDENEKSSKMHFIELRYASRLQTTINMLIGFLVAITTLRLWKMLQFSQSIQLVADSLLLGWRSVGSAIMVICSFMTAFAVAFFVMNGNYGNNFYRLVRSVVCCVCFSLGFSKGLSPDEFSKPLAIILYGSLVLLVAVMLLNISAAVVNDNLTTAKIQQDFHDIHQLSFFHFLRIEFEICVKYLRKFRFFRKYYKSNRRSVSENIERLLSSLETTIVLKKEITVSDIKLETEKFGLHQERVYTIGDIVNTQVDILTRLLYLDNEVPRALDT